MARNRIVVWDPKGDYWEGSLVDEQVAAVLLSRGVALLPVNPVMFTRSGIGGYFKRAWGAGWPLDYSTPRMSCPMAICVGDGQRQLHWALRLMPDPRFEQDAAEGKIFTEGALRVVGDTGQAYAHKTTVTPSGPPVDVRALGRTDAHGGWTVEGDGLIHPPMEGHYGFSLYGQMPGVRVVWAALSLS